MATVAKTATVADAVAFETSLDASPDKREAQRAYVGMTWPLLTFRADVEDDLTWDELLAMPVAEANRMEEDEGHRCPDPVGDYCDGE